MAETERQDDKADKVWDSHEEERSDRQHEKGKCEMRNASTKYKALLLINVFKI